MDRDWPPPVPTRRWDFGMLRHNGNGLVSKGMKPQLTLLPSRLMANGFRAPAAAMARCAYGRLKAEPGRLSRRVRIRCRKWLLTIGQWPMATHEVRLICG